MNDTPDVKRMAPATMASVLLFLVPVMGAVCPMRPGGALLHAESSATSHEQSGETGDDGDDTGGESLPHAAHLPSGVTFRMTAFPSTAGLTLHSREMTRSG